MSYKHLSFEDRTALMLEYQKPDFSPRKFAKQINQHHSAIYRELNRNSTSESCQSKYAIQYSLLRRRREHHKIKLDSILWRFMVQALRCLWSHEQISKRLKQLSESNGHMCISHTTIYSTIRALPKGELKKDLLSCLRHKNKKPKANGEPKKDSILQEIKTIHERPQDVEERYLDIGKLI